MGVILVQEIWSGRQGSQRENSHREYTRVFRVHTNSPHTASSEVRGALGVPSRWDIYAPPSGEADPDALCMRLQAKHDQEDPYTWLVTAEYTTDNPITKPPVIRWKTVRFTKPFVKTVGDLPVQNSAKQPFDPPHEIEDFRLSLTIARNEIVFDPHLVRPYLGSINREPFWGFAENLVRLSNISAEKIGELDEQYWVVTYEFEIRPDETWTVRLLDRGYYLFNSASGKADKPVVDMFGKPMSSPALLDGSGGQLAYTGTPVFLEFDAYPDMDFAELNLPEG
jgi:hypothetical protein